MASSKSNISSGVENTTDTPVVNTDSNMTMTTAAPVGNATVSPAPSTITPGNTTFNGTMAPTHTTIGYNTTYNITLAPDMNGNNSFDPRPSLGGEGGSNIFERNNTNMNTTEPVVTEGNSSSPPTSTTANPGQSECNQLDPGDVFIYVVASDDPNGIGFLALENIPGGLELFMTDNPWVGDTFEGDEGVVKLAVPLEGIESGKEFGFGFDYGAGETWEDESGIFNVGTAGDSVFLYCYGVNGTINPLVGFSNSEAWAEVNLTLSEYGSQESALPHQLSEVGAVVLPHLDNYEYTGPRELDKAGLQAAMMDPENWEGTDEGLGDQRDGIGRVNTSIFTYLVIGFVSFLF